MKQENLTSVALKMNLKNCEKVYSVWDLDDKVSVFNSIVINMFDETIPMKIIRAHCTNKSWLTPNLKAFIKARQRPFTKGETSKYESPHVQVTKLISNAKATYYKSKAEGRDKLDPVKR